MGYVMVQHLAFTIRPHGFAGGMEEKINDDNGFLYPDQFTIAMLSSSPTPLLSPS